MDYHLDMLVNQWLHSSHIPVSPGYVTEKILLDPGYPSLLSISETPDDLAIINAAPIELRVYINRWTDYQAGSLFEKKTL